MKTLYLTLILILLLAVPVMADTDMIRLPTTTHNYTGGIGSLSIDGDFSTCQTASGSGGTGGDCNVGSEHDFAYPVTITQIDFRINTSAVAYSNDGTNVHVEHYVQYYDTAWKEIILPYPPNTNTHYTDGNNGYQTGISAGKDTGHITISGLSLPNVTKIKAYAYARATAVNKKPNTASTASIYELKAFGVVDIGLRYSDGSNIIKIACEPQGVLTSPLRISKNGTTYAITLVDPTDPNASKVRIKTNSGIKALRKY